MIKQKKYHQNFAPQIPIMRRIITAFCLLISVTTVIAQEDSAFSKELTEVIVVGQHRPQSIKNSVYQVRVVNNERIRLSGATNIQQVLVNQLGFRFSNDNTLGTSDIQLMGMSGRNVKILLDGVPMIDRGDTRESLNHMDVNSIEKIEIVEGPMSVSYGSDALAGVINIITKKPGKNGLSVIARAQEETAGNEYHPFSYRGVHSQSLSVNGSSEKWNYAAGGNHNEFDGFGNDQYGRNKPGSWRPKEQWLGNARIGYASNKINIYYRLDGLQEKISSRGPINFDTYRSTDQFYTTKRLMHQLQNQWRIYSKLDLATILSYTDYERRTKTYRHDFQTDLDELTSGKGEQDIARFNSFVFRNTFGYQASTKFSLQGGIDINHEKASGARIDGEPSINDYALFVSAELKPVKNINIRPGLRFIHNSVYDAPPVIPSLNTKFIFNKQWDLRLAYAYGFRSPALRELYFNYVDANHVIVGNPDLEAEYSNSFSGHLSWYKPLQNNWQLQSTLGGFYNVFNNLINYANSPTSNDTTITVNIDKFKTTGVTLENKLSWKELSATLGFAYIGRYNSLSEEYKDDNLPVFTWSPELNSNIIFNAKKINTSFGLFYKFTGARPGYTTEMNQQTSQLEIKETRIASFHWADFTVTKPLFNYFTLTGGVKNIFDVTTLDNTGVTSGGVHTSGGAVPMSYGRSWFLGLTFQWSKK